MPRYTSRPKAWGDDWSAPLLTSIDVPLSDPVDTGLIDEAGNTIWRVGDPIGFRF